jgi:antitoxin HigA-1
MNNHETTMIPTHRRPTHPGNILLHEFLEPFALTPKSLAENIGIRQLLRERGRISPELALRLARYFKTTPDFWLNLQHNVDMWDTLQAKRASIQAITPFTASAP